MPAIFILGETVEWYMPNRVHHGDTSEDVRYEKRFKGPNLYHEYEDWSDYLGLSVGQLKDHVALLKHSDLVDYEVVTSLKYGGNKKGLFIWPNPSAVYELTFGTPAPEFATVSPRIATGHPIVDQIRQIKLHGRYVDHNWMGHPRLCNEKGKPQLIAVLMWSDIFFWHLPRYRVNEVTNEVETAETRFSLERLYKNYPTWAKSFNCEARTFQRYASFLERDSGLIKREIAPIVTTEGYMTQNVVHIEIVLEAALEMTPAPRNESDNGTSQPASGPAPDSGPPPSLDTISGPKLDPKIGMAPCHESTQGENWHGLDPKIGMDSTRKLAWYKYSTSNTSSTKQKKGAFAPAVVGLAAKASNGGPTSNDETSTAVSPTIPAGAPLIRNADGEWINDPEPHRWDVARRQGIIQKLVALDAGLGRQYMRPEPTDGRFWKAWPDDKNFYSNAEFVAKWWKKTPESKQDYWTDKPTGAPSSALRIRLQDPEWLPAKLLGEKQRRQRRAEDEERRRIENEEREAAAREQREIRAERIKVACDVFERFCALSSETQELIERHIQKANPSLADLVKKRGGITGKKLQPSELNVEKLKRGEILWVDYLEHVYYALPEVLAETPQIPALACSPPGEEMDIPPIDAAEIFERNITRLVSEMKSGTLEWDEINDRQGFFTDDEWGQIISEVKLRMRGPAQAP